MKELNDRDGEALYAATEFYRWGENNHRNWFHVVYNAERAAGDFDRLTRQLIDAKEVLIAGKLLKLSIEILATYRNKDV